MPKKLTQQMSTRSMNQNLLLKKDINQLSSVILIS